jgi:hypothetical protein
MLIERFASWFALTLTILFLGYSIHLVAISPPPCIHDCIQPYGSRSCKEDAIYDTPSCYGPLYCGPYCPILRGPTHVEKGQCLRGSEPREQHVTYAAFDCDSDGKEDTACQAWHSCVKPTEWVGE